MVEVPTFGKIAMENEYVGLMMWGAFDSVDARIVVFVILMRVMTPIARAQGAYAHLRANGVRLNGCLTQGEGRFQIKMNEGLICQIANKSCVNVGAHLVLTTRLPTTAHGSNPSAPILAPPRHPPFT